MLTIPEGSSIRAKDIEQGNVDGGGDVPVPPRSCGSGRKRIEHVGRGMELLVDVGRISVGGLHDGEKAAGDFRLTLAVDRNLSAEVRRDVEGTAEVAAAFDDVQRGLPGDASNGRVEDEVEDERRVGKVCAL